MSLNNILDSLIVNFLVDLSNLLHISLNNLTAFIFVIAIFAFLDIFAGSGISEPRMGISVWYYLKNVRKFLPTQVDLLILLLTGFLSLRGLLLPEIKGEKMYVDSNNEFEILAPKNWNRDNTRPFYNQTVNKINFSDQMLITDVDEINYIFIGKLDKNAAVPSGYVEENLNTNNLILGSIHTKSGFSVFDRELFTSVMNEGNNYIIVARSDKSLLIRYLKTLRFL